MHADLINQLQQHAIDDVMLLSIDVFNSLTGSNSLDGDIYYLGADNVEMSAKLHKSLAGRQRNVFLI